MRIDILSLFPGYFQGPFTESILKRAGERKLIEIHLHDIRERSVNKWRRVDDRPFGGGSGMVLEPQPVVDAIRAVKSDEALVIALSPQGKPLTAALARELAKHKHLVLVAGHYEGIDQRALDIEVQMEVSIGDVVLTNGCLAACVLVDSVVRFIPGVLGDERAAENESFEQGLLEGPQFTRPLEYEGHTVPEVLRQGDHRAQRQWRLSAALSKTALMRPDLLQAFVEKMLPECQSPRVVVWVENVKRSMRFFKAFMELKGSGEKWALFAGKGMEIALVEGASPEIGALPFVGQLPETFGWEEDPDHNLWRLK